MQKQLDHLAPAAQTANSQHRKIEVSGTKHQNKGLNRNRNFQHKS